MAKTRYLGKVACALALFVAGCGLESSGVNSSDANVRERIGDSAFGAGGLFSLNVGGQQQPGSTIAVNSYLWRATLDTVAFMPLASADPFGGVIITDWYSPPESPNERFKINVFILNQQLRADGIRASVFRQRLDDRNQWTDSPVDVKTATELENAILTRARQLRISQS